MKAEIRHILLDIEGTTCPVSFVSDVLFPYANREVERYLERHQHLDDVRRLIEELLLHWQREEDGEAQALLRRHGSPLSAWTSAGGDENSPGSPQTSRVQVLLPYLRWLIEKDRKVTAWKELQGRIWREGYGCGELQATLYPEVATTLQRWKEEGLQLSVYSSGSVAAQQLLYGHCQAGDLRPLFSHWFDTRVGAKQESRSYQDILNILQMPASQVLFVSDSVAELKAASAVGMRVVFSDREGNPQRDPCGFPSIRTLAEINPHDWDGMTAIPDGEGKGKG
jgi:enolase-phosphatase E1